MKILIANMFYYPNLAGGTEYSVKLLAENLALRQHEVHVLSMDGDESFDGTKTEVLNGVTVHRLHSKTIYRRRILKDKSHKTDSIWNGLHSIYNPKIDSSIKKLVDEIKPDLIHTQNMISMSYGIWKIARSKNIPLVHTLRDYWLLDPTTVIDRSPKAFTYFFRAYTRCLSNKYAPYVTAPSQRTIDIFHENKYFLNSKSECVVNAIPFDQKLFEDCLDEKKKRSEPVRFIFAGLLAENKGVKVLVEAFKASHTNGTLTICGGGDLYSWIEEQNVPGIVLKGRLKQEELFTEYRKADVLIVPSLWEEPFGRIVIEGVQFGLLPIGADKGGIPEIIRTLDFGEIYSSTDTNQLKAFIEEYADRNILNQTLENASCNLDIYGIERQIDEFERIYRGLIS